MLKALYNIPRSALRALIVWALNDVQPPPQDAAGIDKEAAARLP
jgi:hypothetical protein